MAVARSRNILTDSSCATTGYLGDADAKAVRAPKPQASSPPPA